MTSREKDIAIDLWNVNRSLDEFINLVNTAKGPEDLQVLFIEARSELSKEDYRIFREKTVDHYKLLLECGGGYFDASY